MAEETGIDANGSEQDRIEISSISDSLLSSPDGNARPVSTVEVEEGGAQDNTDKTPDTTIDEKAGDKTGEGAGDNTQDDKASSSGQEGRYDKDPAWQRIIKERNDAKAEIAALKAKDAGKPAGEAKEAATATEGQLPYKDITKMSDEELREWQEDDPKGYAVNLFTQIQFETERVQEQRKSQADVNSKMEATFTNYAKANPDFNTMWDSGEIEDFMTKNPGHNAISAHMAMTQESRIAAAAERAAKEAEERVIKNFQAKRNATVLTDSPAHRSGKDDIAAELKNTKQFGGKTAVMADRLARMRGGGV
ncbi:MAG: hypothetical protein LLG40_09840 [Deltaproteobacteria bacterium]|nr:hypothetical protein [Deltaproteobacteria bacterium]